EQPDALELVFRNRRRPALHRHDVHDARAFEDRERIVGVQLREAVPGEQRPIDLLLAILPPAPASDGRQKRDDILPIELLTDDLLVAGAGPDGEPPRPDI